MHRLNSNNCSRKVIGNYEYYQNRVAGRGTNSVVFEGKNIHTNEPVCVKQLHIKSAVAERFAKTQIQVLKKAQHKNVLKYVGHYERENHIYIITERCEMNLQTKIKKKPKTKELQGMKQFLQILEGYQQLRNRGYIHRDIKPENILVKGDLLKIADFGYGTLLKRVSIKESFNVGTPLYMAPESLALNIYSQKSDIWSLGATLHEILHGKAPFSSQTEQQLRKELRRPLKLSICDERVMKLISYCLSYQVQNRYDLQKLMLETKLIISHFQQQQEAQKQEQIELKRSFLCVNELNYIRFLENIKTLAARARNIPQQTRARIIFLFEHQIQMRLKINEDMFDDHSGSLSERVIQKFRAYQNEHQGRLELPPSLAQNDRLYFFTLRIEKFDESLQWQTQAEMKQIIRVILGELKSCRSEYQATIRQQTIKLVDFLLSSFALNRLLIQKENDREQFARQSNLSLILNSPCRVNLRVLVQVLKKAEQLKVA